MMKRLINILVFIILINLTRQYQLGSLETNRPRKNAHHHHHHSIIFKKLTSIEINENIQIGYLINDLKANIIASSASDPNLINTLPHYDDSFYFTFEFLNDYHENNPIVAGNSNNYLLQNYLKTYFLLDSYTGTIHTSKSIDMENFCDLNLCQNRNKNFYLEVAEISIINNNSNKDCVIPFRVRATKHFYHNKTNQNIKESVYHISFDLIIHDLNEFSPEFSQKEPISFNISEEFAPIKLPLGSVAYDNDCIDRNSLSYSVKINRINQKSVDEFLKDVKSLYNKDLLLKNKANLFDFHILIEQDHSLLFLYTNRSIDRELVQSIELEVIARDRPDYLGDGKEASLKITINIADINDNAPKFETQVYNLEFDEGLASNTELLKLSAYDPDSGLNGEIRYEFAIMNDEIKDTFLVHPVHGSLILKKKLDYDRKKYWQLSIRASDQSQNPKSSIALVNLRVNDVNNNKPEISLNFFLVENLIEPKLIVRKDFDKDSLLKEEVIYLSKNVPRGSVIGLVFVSDKDSELNGYIDSCELNLIPNANSNKKETLKQQIPVYLEEFKSLTQNNYSSDYTLNTEIMSILKNYQSSNANISGHSTAAAGGGRERRYFLRTSLDFAEIFENGFYGLTNRSSLNYIVEVSATDRGSAIRLTGKKDFQLVVLNNKNRKYLDEDYPLDNEEEEQLFEEQALENNDIKRNKTQELSDSDNYVDFDESFNDVEENYETINNIFYYGKFYFRF
jgi:hypothetical protein